MNPAVSEDIQIKNQTSRQGGPPLQNESPPSGGLSKNQTPDAPSNPSLKILDVVVVRLVTLAGRIALRILTSRP